MALTSANHPQPVLRRSPSKTTLVVSYLYHIHKDIRSCSKLVTVWYSGVMMRHDELQAQHATDSDPPTPRDRSEPLSPVPPSPVADAAGPADPPPAAEKWDPPVFKSGKNKGKERTFSQHITNMF